MTDALVHKYREQIAEASIRWKATEERAEAAEARCTALQQQLEELKVEHRHMAPVALPRTGAKLEPARPEPWRMMILALVVVAVIAWLAG